jgi:hypothetical protein
MKIVEFFLIMWGKWPELEPEPEYLIFFQVAHGCYFWGNGQKNQARRWGTRLLW